MTVLELDDLLTGIRRPATSSRAQFDVEKVRDRQVWDFALVNIAAALQRSGGRLHAQPGAAGDPRRRRGLDDLRRQQTHGMLGCAPCEL
jgi:xanthine dehydrogenase YagS FAD-binding subunit